MEKLKRKKIKKKEKGEHEKRGKTKKIESLGKTGKDQQKIRERGDEGTKRPARFFSFKILCSTLLVTLRFCNM